MSPNKLLDLSVHVENVNVTKCIRIVHQNTRRRNAENVIFSHLYNPEAALLCLHCLQKMSWDAGCSQLRQTCQYGRTGYGVRGY